MVGLTPGIIITGVMANTYTKEQLLEKLETNVRWVERAIIAIYHRQTLDEQSNNTTKYHNNVGFSAAHARLGTYYARWLMINGNHLSGQHIEKARKIAIRYVGQLVDIANGSV